MTATRREAIQLLERVPEDKLTYVVQILSSIDDKYIRQTHKEN